MMATVAAGVYGAAASEPEEGQVSVAYLPLASRCSVLSTGAGVKRRLPASWRCQGLPLRLERIQLLVDWPGTGHLPDSHGRPR